MPRVNLGERNKKIVSSGALNFLKEEKKPKEYNPNIIFTFMYKFVHF